ncbi:MAG: acyl-CoA dehydrogenase family protein [Chromatocurvus sp.]
MKQFINEHIVPVEAEYIAEIAVGDRWQFTDRQIEIMEGLKREARKQGLWNFFLTDGEHGSGLTTVEYAYLAEEMGKSHIAEISQGRLGPGRIHHCMRALGAAEKALRLMCERATTRVAFGKPLARLGGNIDIVANARMDIEQARLLTLKAAWMMDNVDPREARVWISMIKTVVPNVTIRIVDEAIQMFGGLGVSQDTPLAGMYMAQRTLRLADGPDAVHRMVVGRNELKKYAGQQDINATFRDG